MRAERLALSSGPNLGQTAAQSAYYKPKIEAFHRVRESYRHLHVEPRTVAGGDYIGVYRDHSVSGTQAAGRSVAVNQEAPLYPQS